MIEDKDKLLIDLRIKMELDNEIKLEEEKEGNK